MRSDSKTPVVLLCAASGTRLTKIAKQLSASTDPEAVQDLEARLCAEYRGHLSHKDLGLQADELPSMWHVARRPREELFKKWKVCFGKGIRTCASHEGAPFRLICMHLRWYNPDTTEFFSPVSIDYLKRETGRAGCTIQHVIILIDDVYDMYRRLQGPNDIYRPKLIEARRDRLHELHYGREATAHSRSQAYVEAVESALVHLIAWRQHEILNTEDLARELKADYTILGIKHAERALCSLLTGEDTPRTYLSHRISEVRRLNKAQSDLPEELGEWSEVVEEVNNLHLLFADRSQLLINPTAIDELRFGDSSGREETAPFLALRWSIPDLEDNLLWKAPQGGDDHTRLLCGDLELPDPVASSVVRSLSSRIYFDISFRDHVIVENTPGLCVYRPFFRSVDQGRTGENRGTDWSGGVRPEINHWYAKTLFDPEKKRGVALVHTRAEIRARLLWLHHNDVREFAETMLSHLPDVLAHFGIGVDVGESLCTDIRRVLNERRSGSHLAQDPAPQVVQLPAALRADPVSLIDALEVVYLVGMFHAYTLLTRPPNLAATPLTIVPEFDVYLLLADADEASGQLVDDLGSVADRLCRFFAKEFVNTCSECTPNVNFSNEEEVVDGVNLCIGCDELEFWQAHKQEFDLLGYAGVLDFCCTSLALPYEYLVSRSSELESDLVD